MRKAERLFQLVNYLRSRRQVVTAAQLAESLEVSERTIYRDIQALSLSGIPIEGEAGVGYRIRPGFNLPPIMFELDELEAIRFGVRMVQAWAGPELAKSATQALEKIEAVLPEATHHALHKQVEQLVVPKPHQEVASQFSDDIRHAIKQSRKLELEYQDETGKPSSRVVWPFGLVYWGSTWTLVAWCELRFDYRMFRLDRVQSLNELEHQFEPEPDKNLEHYLSLQC
jgi:predicted DNA-binding transcriptional regulator YafY